MVEIRHMLEHSEIYNLAARALVSVSLSGGGGDIHVHCQEENICIAPTNTALQSSVGEIA